MVADRQAGAPSLQPALQPAPEPALQVEGVSKCYRIYAHPRDRLLQAVWGGRRQLYREFWALRELSFSLERGQTLGVVGRNGSGKSTLLQLICGTLTPSSGRVTVQGRIGALLELGSGFNPEFSGRENVLLNATLLGLRRSEIEERLDAILAFADIGAFIDQPVKTYSSGMVVRLAFAVQAHIDPDLLVVDEALAVGDELFQKKCYGHLERLKERGTSILLVTHSCPQIIQHCDAALLLHRGRARLLGRPAPVTVLYQRLINASDEEWDRVLPAGAPAGDGTAPTSATPSSSGAASASPEAAGAEARGNATEARGSAIASGDVRAWLDPALKPDSTVIYPERGARIAALRIETLDGEAVNVLPLGQPFRVVLQGEASADLEADLEGVSCSCHIASLTGQRLTGQRYPQAGRFMEPIAAGTTWHVSYSFQGGLWPGIYFLGAGILSTTERGRSFLHRVVDISALRILDDPGTAVIGSCNLQLEPPTLHVTGAGT